MSQRVAFCSRLFSGHFRSLAMIADNSMQHVCDIGGTIPTDQNEAAICESALLWQQEFSLRSGLGIRYSIVSALPNNHNFCHVATVSRA
jgi:hypothetical protein